MNTTYRIPVIYMLTGEQYERLQENCKLAEKTTRRAITPEEELQSVMTFGSTFDIDSRLSHFEHIYKKVTGENDESES